MNFDEKDLEITTCKSPKTNLLGAEVGVKIKHKKLDITVQSIDLPTQHQNKLAAIELMKEAAGTIKHYRLKGGLLQRMLPHSRHA